MAPEGTANPSRHKFLDIMGRLALDPEAGVPAEDPLADRLLEPQIDADAEFLAQLAEQFPFAAKVRVNQGHGQRACFRLCLSAGQTMDASMQIHY